jgi:hypothetical protein
LPGKGKGKGKGNGQGRALRSESCPPTGGRTELMDVQTILGLVVVYLALAAAVIFVAMVVVGELVLIIRWLRQPKQL